MRAADHHHQYNHDVCGVVVCVCVVVVVVAFLFVFFPHHHLILSAERAHSGLQRTVIVKERMVVYFSGMFR
jgi:hypothetical protein